MTRPVGFKQKDVVRLLKAAKAAGITPTRVWVESDGKIVLGISDDDGLTSPPDAKGNEWDAVLSDDQAA